MMYSVKAVRLLEKCKKKRLVRQILLKKLILDVVLDELAKLKVKYDDIKAHYEEKCLLFEEKNEEVLTLKEKLIEVNIANKTNVEEYKQSIDLLQKELSLIKGDKMQIEDIKKY
ncbi:hypothetical protein QLX08_004384 [Tetragonisca angustula]|uniref:Uncharacterized protein n=1 Tax=Tetragonisca angustula TaxID=166442 RepID=A0AAW1A2Q6_9HYME